jgi:hypothetical protein
LDSDVRVGLFLGREDPIWAGYTGFEVQGRHNQVRREGGLVWAKKTKNQAMGAQFWLAITVVPSY